MISGTQIRCARAALRLSIAELAARAGVGVQTIMRFEASDGVPPSRSSTLLDVQKALEEAGVEFIGAPEEGPGVRLWRNEPR
jgi:DNA-binding transcriptional regulator YiaG